MKFIIVIFFLFIVGFRQPDNDKIQFISKIIENPFKYDSVIENSIYYKNKFWLGNMDMKHIVTEKLNDLRKYGYEIGDCNYEIFRVKNKIWLKCCVPLHCKKDKNKVTYIFISKESYSNREQGEKIIKKTNSDIGWYLNRIKAEGPDL